MIKFRFGEPKTKCLHPSRGPEALYLPSIYGSCSLEFLLWMLRLWWGTELLNLVLTHWHKINIRVPAIPSPNRDLSAKYFCLPGLSTHFKKCINRNHHLKEGWTSKDLASEAFTNYRHSLRDNLFSAVEPWSQKQVDAANSASIPSSIELTWTNLVCPINSTCLIMSPHPGIHCLSKSIFWSKTRLMK